MFHLDDPKKWRIYHELEKQALDGGVGKSEDESANELSTTDKGVKYLWRAHKGGCDACNHNGYKGRIGIYESLGNSEEIQAMIVSNATSDKIQQQAMAEGMITMQMDGFIKALRGLTAIEEILKGNKRIIWRILAYTARNPQDQIVKGTVSAASREAAMQTIIKQGLKTDPCQRRGLFSWSAGKKLLALWR
jgi:hypothetical protein